jgi:hypothetical protein
MTWKQEGCGGIVLRDSEEGSVLTHETLYWMFLFLCYVTRKTLY